MMCSIPKRIICSSALHTIRIRGQWADRQMGNRAGGELGRLGDGQQAGNATGEKELLGYAYAAPWFQVKLGCLDRAGAR